MVLPLISIVHIHCTPPTAMATTMTTTVVAGASPNDFDASISNHCTGPDGDSDPNYIDNSGKDEQEEEGGNEPEDKHVNKEVRSMDEGSQKLLMVSKLSLAFAFLTLTTWTLSLDSD